MAVTGMITTMVMADQIKITAINLFDYISVNLAGRVNNHLAINTDNTFNYLRNKTQIMRNQQDGHLAVKFC